MNWLIKVLFYAGVDRKIYESVSDFMAEDNRKNLSVFSGVSVIALAVMVVSIQLDASLAKNSNYSDRVTEARPRESVTDRLTRRQKYCVFPEINIPDGA